MMWDDCTPTDGESLLLGVIGRSLGFLGNVINEMGRSLFQVRWTEALEG
jgi:hypothetical protein